MNDERIWEFERNVWLSAADALDTLIADEALFIVPAPPFIMTGTQAKAEMAKSPRWSTVRFSGRQVYRPQEGIIVVAYRADAELADGKPYSAYCTSTFHRLAHDDWRTVQHQQTQSDAPANE